MKFVNGIGFKVIAHSLREADLREDGGVARSAVGWYKVRLEDGKTVEAAGRWDDAFHQDDDHPASVMEVVTVDGVLVEGVPEVDDGAARIRDAAGDSCSAEDIAWKILEDRR